jgi:septum formation inhibitor-activating ATPase MinD
MSDLVLVKLLLGLVRAENNRLKAYNAGDVISVTSKEAEHMIFRRRAERVEPEAPPVSTESAPAKPAPSRKKRGS